MKLTTLWTWTYERTWTYEPEINKATSCYLLKADNKNIVFDFGRWAINQLLKVNVKYHEIDAIFITHPHADHCCDLASLFHIALCEIPSRSFRNKDLTIYWPIGIEKSINHILEAFGLHTRKPKYKIIVKELENEEIVHLGNIKIQSFDVNHVGNCISYRIENSGKVISLSGDSGVCEWLIKSIKNSDLAILESTIPNREEVIAHLNPETAIKISKENNVKKLALTHIWSGAFDDVKNINDENVIIAEDLMEFEV